MTRRSASGEQERAVFYGPRRNAETAGSSAGLLVLWRWGRVVLPVQGLRADRVYERSRRTFFSRNEVRTDTLPVLARPSSLARLPAAWRAAAPLIAPFPARGAGTGRTSH